MIKSLPQNWVLAPLADLGDMIGGGTPSKANPAFWIDGTIPWVSPKDFRSSVIADAQDHITEAALDASSTNLVPKGSVLVVTRSGILSNSFPVAIAAVPVAINQDVKAIVLSEGISPAYVVAALQRYGTRILRECTKPGTTVPSVLTPRLQTFSIPVAPSREQNRVVAAIEAISARVMSAKHAVTSIPSLLDRYQSFTLDLALRGNATRAWRNQLDKLPSDKWLETLVSTRRNGGETTSSPSPKAIENFALANGVTWPFVTLASVCEPSRTITYGVIQTGDDTPDGVPTVRAGDIKNFSINLQNLKRIRRQTSDRYPRTLLQGGEVLLSIRGTVGNVAVASKEMAGMNVSREVAVVPVIAGIDPHYVAYALASPTGQAIITGHIKGIAQSGINLVDLRNFPLPMPTPAEQREIVGFIDRTIQQIRALRARVEELEAALDELLASTLRKAFVGELTSEEPDDEPASILVKRSRVDLEKLRARPRKKKVDKTQNISTRKLAMPQSRKTVKSDHLSKIVAESKLKSLPVKELYLRADMEVDEFYKQLAAEVALGMLRQNAAKTHLELSRAT